MFRLLMSGLFLISFVHCSSHKDEVVKALTHPNSGGDATKSVQFLPADVPSISASSSYFGKLTMLTGKAMEYNLVDGTNTKIVDFEFTSKTYKDLWVDQFSSSYIGSCPSRSEKLTWIHVDKNGGIYTSEPVNFVDFFSAVPNYRYILRVQYNNVKNCQQIYTTLKIMEN